MLSERLSMPNSGSLVLNSKFQINGNNYLYDKIKQEKPFDVSSNEISPKHENGDLISVHSNNNSLASNNNNNNNNIKSERLSPSNSNNSSNSNTTNSVSANNNHSNLNNSGNGNNSLMGGIDGQSITSR